MKAILVGSFSFDINESNPDRRDIRGTAVADFLKPRLQSKFKIQALGETLPVASIQTAAGQPKNRLVEVLVR